MLPIEAPHSIRQMQRSSCLTPPAAPISVLNTADTVIAQNDRAISRIIQLDDDAGALLVAYADSTAGGTKYTFKLNPGTAAGLAGGCLIITDYTGPIALRGVGAAVNVVVTEV